jgi:hypothetical protein
MFESPASTRPAQGDVERPTAKPAILEMSGTVQPSSAPQS